MSHVVLARKYRPRSFDQMVGQEHVVRAVTNALRSGRLHHAYLFTGTRGIGKTTVSRILAKSLNCTGADGLGGITAQPCGVCQACTEIDADRYIDYIEMDAASNRSIEEIRELIERAAYKPAVGRFKVFMIDEAHQLTKDAFNALLKTLEEPPEYLKFVLATTDPERMLPTVLSRCLQFNLRPMPPEVVAGHLKTVLISEGVQFDDASLRLLARAARGSMRDGLSLTDQAIAYGAGRLEEVAVRIMLGSVDHRLARDLISALARRDGLAVLTAVQSLREGGLSAAGTLEAMAMVLQQMAVHQAVPAALDDSDAQARAAADLASEMAPDDTQLLYSICIHGRAELSLVGDEYAALTMVLLRLLAFPVDGVVVIPAARTAAKPLQAVPREARLSTAALPPPTVAVLSHALAATARDDLPKTRAVVNSKPSDEPPPWAFAALPDETVEVGVGRASPPLAQSGPAVATSTALRAKPMLQPTALGLLWDTQVRQLFGRPGFTALVRELAMQSELVAMDVAQGLTTLRLRVERESLRTAALKDRLQSLLMSSRDDVVQIELEPGEAFDSPALRDAAERERTQSQAEQTIHGDPVVQALLGQFQTARIVAGSIRPVSDSRKD